MSGSARLGQRTALTGVQKSAVLCMALGPESASRILQQLDPEEIEDVTREIATLGAVEPEVVQAVLEEFRAAAGSAGSSARGGLGYAQQVLEQAIGAPRARAVMGRVQEQVQEPAMPKMRRLPVETVRGLLQGEHPQTIALVLAHLEPKRAAELAASLGPEIATDALARLARMERIAPDVPAAVDEQLARRADPATSRPPAQGGGPGTVARLLNLAGSALNQQLLEGLQSAHPELAERIQSLMFVFEDLKMIDNKGLQRLLREVESRELAMALKGASPELRAHVRTAMSERAAGALDEEMEVLGPVRVKEVEAVHAKILENVRQLEAAGELMIPGRGGQDDVLV